MSDINPAVLAAQAAMAKLTQNQASKPSAELQAAVIADQAAGKANGSAATAVGVKTYKTRIANSTFVVQRGPARTETLQFHGILLDVPLSDEVAIEQLDGCADVRGSMIYTDKPVIDPGEAQAQREIQEQAAKAAKAAAGTV